MMNDVEAFVTGVGVIFWVLYFFPTNGRSGCSAGVSKLTRTA